jgi:hypothetical protein
MSDRAQKTLNEIRGQSEVSEATFTRDWWQGGVTSLIKRLAAAATRFTRNPRGGIQPNGLTPNFG